MRTVKTYTLESRLGRRMAREGRILILTRRHGPVRYGVLNGDRVEAWADLETMARTMGCMAEDEVLVKVTATVIKVRPAGEAG